MQFGPSDALVVYSDGITEASDTQQELPEEERLLEVVQAKMRRTAQGIQDALISELHGFVGDAPQSNDITLIVLVRGQVDG